MALPARHLYIVHMKRVTASEARRNWFRILDEVAAGEVVVVERHGRAIQLTRASVVDHVREIPDYSGSIRAPDGADHADRWGWEWSVEEGDVRPVDASARLGEERAGVPPTEGQA